jgi:lipopolysaccharide/colanic/teichoic acid biosynthesis glycosyltransferase
MAFAGSPRQSSIESRAAFLLVVLAVLMLLGGGGHRATSSGPGLYRLTRMILAIVVHHVQIRTMVSDADQTPWRAAQRARWADGVKLRNDPRVTTIGRLLC